MPLSDRDRAERKDAVEKLENLASDLDRDGHREAGYAAHSLAEDITESYVTGDEAQGMVNDFRRGDMDHIREVFRESDLRASREPSPRFDRERAGDKSPVPPQKTIAFFGVDSIDFSHLRVTTTRARRIHVVIERLPDGQIIARLESPLPVLPPE